MLNAPAEGREEARLAANLKVIEHRAEEPMPVLQAQREPVPVHGNQDQVEILDAVSQSGEIRSDDQGAADATNVIEYRPKRPMWSADAQRQPVPAAAGDREAPVPDAWGRGGERRAAG